jgi:hypothetical protein
MSTMTLVEPHLLNLEGRVPEESLHYVRREFALKRLREMSGKDFGDDAEAWRKWYEQHSEADR